MDGPRLNRRKSDEPGLGARWVTKLAIAVIYRAMEDIIGGQGIGHADQASAHTFFRGGDLDAWCWMTGIKVEVLRTWYWKQQAKTCSPSNSTSV